MNTSISSTPSPSSTNTAGSALEVMQAFAAIHSAIDKLSQTQFEPLNSLEIAAIQSYYALVKQKLIEQEQKFSLSPSEPDSAMTPQASAETDAAATLSPEPTKTRQPRKTSSSSSKKSKSKQAASMDAYLEFYEDLKAGFADLE